eukprot:gene17349-23653_t
MSKANIYAASFGLVAVPDYDADERHRVLLATAQEVGIGNIIHALESLKRETIVQEAEDIIQQS